ncbi:DsbA family protein [Candidatus Saccharibacteria bacterium]|nr:DsbA family protein [Candidatus Saccharibacteria bacterium]
MPQTKQTNKRRNIILIVLAVLVVLAGTVFIVRNRQQHNQQSSADAPTVNTPAVTEGSTSNALIIGNPNAPVTIVEYGDFKCPNCNKLYRGALREIKKNYIDTGKAKLEFRNLPYISPDSRTAAEGAYCANAQGVFEAYHNGVYDYIWDSYYRENKVSEGESTDVFTVQTLTDIATQAGADPAEFAACLNQQTYKDAVTADLKASERDKATGTPTVFIGNQRIIGAQPYTVYSTLIEQELR